MQERPLKNTGPRGDPEGDTADRLGTVPVVDPAAGPGESVPAAGLDEEDGEVTKSGSAPVQRLEDIYTFAYSAGYRLGLPEDVMLESLVEMRRNLASYLTGPEQDSFERLGEFTGQWWTAFGLGWADRRSGKEADPKYRGELAEG